MTYWKSILRKQILSARKILDEKEWIVRNEAISRYTLQYLEESKAQVVHCFLPIDRNREVNTWTIAKSLIARSVQVVVSVTDFEKEVMRHFQYNEKVKFRVNKFHIPEPVDAPDADLSSVDTVLVPLLAADRQGNRIGYGKGYYDRLLHSMDPSVRRVGLCLAPLFDAFPFAELHDEKLTYCITPFQIVRCHE